MKSDLNLLLLILLVSNSVSAGVMPARSRVVYSENSREQSLMLANTNRYPVIVQTWIDHGEGSPDVTGIPFVSVPPVFRLEPQGVKGVRIIYNGKPVPADRESLYWFNIYEIPPEKKDALKENSVLVTMNTQIKLFYRPARVTMIPEKALSQVTCHRTEVKVIACHNPSPIHLSVIALQVNTGEGSVRAIDSDLLMSPFTDKIFHLSKDVTPTFSAEIRYINDAGEQLTYTVGPQR